MPVVLVLVVGAPAPVVVAAPQVPSDRGNAANAQGALAAASAGAAAAGAARERSSLLLVELLGLGTAAGPADETEDEAACRRQQERDRQAGRSATACPRGVSPGR